MVYASDNLMKAFEEALQGDRLLEFVIDLRDHVDIHLGKQTWAVFTAACFQRWGQPFFAFPGTKIEFPFAVVELDEKIGPFDSNITYLALE